MTKDRLNELFWKLINGEPSDAEKIEFFSGLEQPEMYSEIERLSLQVWKDSSKLPDGYLDPEAERRINMVMDRIEEKKKKKWPLWMGIAAASLITFIAVAFWGQLHPASYEVQKVVYYEIKTEYGQKKTIRLPDSTTVFLNAGSSIRYSSEFNKKNRSLMLNGEAYFEVAKNAFHPFVVESEGLSTEVLGTTFNIKAFSDENEVFVALKSGGLKIAQPNRVDKTQTNTVFLKPGEKMRYNKKQKKGAVERIHALETWGNWRNEVLSFNELPFSKIKLMIERWYDVNIHVTNRNLLNCRFTGSFDDQPVNRVLTLLSKSSQFTYTIHNKDIYITGAGCQ